jgi:hypothetical protein
MNKQQFHKLLEQLTEDDWHCLNTGQAILMVDDQSLACGNPQSPNTIVKPPAGLLANQDALKQRVMEKSKNILENYYWTHALTRQGFNHQALALFEQHGADAFAAAVGELPQFTLFVDGGEVVAEPRNAPRHRYGVFYEIESRSFTRDISQRVLHWLQQGHAHERYLEMNVCRYNC